MLQSRVALLMSCILMQLKCPSGADHAYTQGALRAMSSLEASCEAGFGGGGQLRAAEYAKRCTTCWLVYFAFK